MNTKISSDAPSLRDPAALSVKQRLALFADDILDFLWDGSDLDGGDIQHLAEKWGVITEVKFDPRRHDDHYGYGVAPGDPWFVPSRGLRAAVRSAKTTLGNRKGGSSPHNSEAP